MWDPLLGWVKCNWMIFGVVLDNILITLEKKNTQNNLNFYNFSIIITFID